MSPRLDQIRREYHHAICSTILGPRSGDAGCLSVADRSSVASRTLAAGMAERIGLPLCDNPKTGQSTGSLFTAHTEDFIRKSFGLLHHLRPGEWTYSTSQNSAGISAYSQYEYLADFQLILQEDSRLKSALGGDYLITPDIVVARMPVKDEEINNKGDIISTDSPFAKRAHFRQSNYANVPPSLHASISCKWSMRSDRAQNTRTEALNLIRNRKGKTPIIVAVTMEPLPSRLASIALGTGDIDCTYHAALHELFLAAQASDYEDQFELLQTMVNGDRLRDISDLPFDMAI